MISKKVQKNLDAQGLSSIRQWKFDKKTISVAHENDSTVEFPNTNEIKKLWLVFVE